MTKKWLPELVIRMYLTEHSRLLHYWIPGDTVLHNQPVYYVVYVHVILHSYYIYLMPEESPMSI